MGSCLASCLVKLILKAKHTLGEHDKQVNTFRAESMLIITSIIRLGRSELPANKMDNDSFERMLFNLKLIANNEDKFSKIILQDQRKAFSAVLKKEDEKKLEVQRAAGKDNQTKCQVDDLLQFRQLQARSSLGGSPADSFDIDLIRATGTDDEKDKKISKLDSIVQLTGKLLYLKG